MMNDTYKEIGALLNEIGYTEYSFVTESVTDKILYISLYCPAIILYSKVESVKKVLCSYDVSVSANPNVECILIKIIE